MPNLTDTTANFSITEKVQYALKTALYRTMQTSLGDSAASEKSAPLRIFPNNIMKVNLIEKDAGDIDADGYYVGKADSNSAWNGSTDLVDLENAELTIAKYKIINPSNNIITDVKVETLAGTYATKIVSYINGRSNSGTSYPWKNWFFRGHYVGATDTLKYAAANDTYDGLQLAWDKSTTGGTATESDIVPHLKYYLQVQTDYTNVATSGNEDNITYIHDKMKGIIGLDQNFSSSIVVCQGEGGGSTNLGATGGSAGDYWFTQPTAGIVSFYGVGNSGTAKVASNLGLSNLATTKFPMISFVRYTGETGFGAGTGGGGSVTLVSADSNVDNMIGGTAQTMSTTTFEFDGNVGIGTTSPDSKLHVISTNIFDGIRVEYSDSNPAGVYIGYGGISSIGNTRLRLGANNTEHMCIDGGNVGIGTTSPQTNLHVETTITSSDTTVPMDSDALNNTVGLYLSNRYDATFNYGMILGSLYNATAYIQSISNDGNGRNLVLNPGGGNVGIGTTSPDSKLHIDGGTTGSTAFNDVLLKLSGTSTQNYGSVGMLFNMREGASGAKSAIFSKDYAGTWNRSSLVFCTNNDSNSNDATLSDAQMVIRETGNVGIGTTSPGEKLCVNGSIMIKGSSNSTVTNDSKLIFTRDLGDTDESEYIARIYTGAYNGPLILESARGGGYVKAMGNSTTNNPLMIITNHDNAEKFRVCGNGNVGIGTTSPGAPLEIYKKGHNADEKGGAIILSRFVQGQDGVTANASDPYRGSCIWHEYNGNDCMMFASSSNANPYTLSPSMVLTTQGNVGIGTTSPKERLDVGNGKICFQGGTFGGTCGISYYYGTQTFSRPVLLFDSGGSTIIRSTSTAGIEGIRFQSYDGTERMFIRNDGNVGIGTTSPSQLLHIFNSSTSWGAYANIRLSTDTNNGNTNYGEIGYFRGTNSSADEGLVFSGRNASRKDMVILSSNGNVGIGTTSPAVKLDVNGHEHVRTLCVGNYNSFSSIDSGDNVKLQISNSSNNANMAIEFSGYTNGHRGGNQSLAKIICQSNDTSNYENHKIIFKIRGWGTNGTPHHQPLNNRFQFDGSGYGYASVWSSSSDDRIKHNEKNITNAMDIINKLKAKLYFKSNDIKEYNYNYELDNSGNPITDEYYRLEAGFIAQELREIPELKFCVIGKEYIDDFENCFEKDASGNNILDENNEPVLIPEHLGTIPNKLSVSYNDIFVMNVQATKELYKQQQIDKQEIKLLKDENVLLKSELAMIKTHLGI